MSKPAGEKSFNKKHEAKDGKRREDEEARTAPREGLIKSYAQPAYRTGSQAFAYQTNDPRPGYRREKSFLKFFPADSLASIDPAHG